MRGNHSCDCKHGRQWHCNSFSHIYYSEEKKQRSGMWHIYISSISRKTILINFLQQKFFVTQIFIIFQKVGHRCQVNKIGKNKFAVSNNLSSPGYSCNKKPQQIKRVL